MTDILTRLKTFKAPENWDADKLVYEAANEIEQLRMALEVLLEASRRAVHLSVEHSNFKLYAMEPMHQAIGTAVHTLKDAQNTGR